MSIRIMRWCVNYGLVLSSGLCLYNLATESMAWDFLLFSFVFSCGAFYYVHRIFLPRLELEQQDDDRQKAEKKASKRRLKRRKQ